jgi:hypothetical protein
MSVLAILLTIINADPSAGASGFDFLRIAPSAREAALGGAAIATAQSPLGFWYSPAHVGAAPEQRAHLGYLNYAAGIHIGSLAYTQPMGKEAGLGIGIVYLNSGTMKRTNERGEQLGTFSSSYADLNVSGAIRPMDRLTFGLGLQGLYGSIDTFFSLGFAGNIGAVYELPVNGLSAGVAIQNVGIQARAFGTERDPMPLDYGIGLSYQPNSAVNLALDIHKPSDTGVGVRAGVEGWIADLLALRLGYNSTGADLKAGGGGDVLAGVTTGLGVRYRGYQIDYCFVPMVLLGAAHRISLSFSL